MTQMLLREQQGALHFLLDVLRGTSSSWTSKEWVLTILLSCTGDGQEEALGGQEMAEKEQASRARERHEIQRLFAQQNVRDILLTQLWELSNSNEHKQEEKARCWSLCFEILGWYVHAHQEHQLELVSEPMIIPTSNVSIMGWILQLELTTCLTCVRSAAATFLDRLLHESELIRMTMLQHLVQPPPATLNAAGDEVALVPAAQVLLDQAFPPDKEPIDMEKKQDGQRLATRRFWTFLQNSRVCCEIARAIQHTPDPRLLWQVLVEHVFKKDQTTTLQVLYFRLLLEWLRDDDVLVSDLASNVECLSSCLDLVLSTTTSLSKFFAALVLSRCLFDPNVDAAQRLLASIHHRIGFSAFDRILTSAVSTFPKDTQIMSEEMDVFSHDVRRAQAQMTRLYLDEKFKQDPVQDEVMDLRAQVAQMQRKYQDLQMHVDRLTQEQQQNDVVGPETSSSNNQDLEAALLATETQVDQLEVDVQDLRRERVEYQTSRAKHATVVQTLEAQRHDLLLLLANEECWHMVFRDLCTARLSQKEIEEATVLAQSKGAFRMTKA